MNVIKHIDTCARLHPHCLFREGSKGIFTQRIVSQYLGENEGLGIKAEWEHWLHPLLALGPYSIVIQILLISASSSVTCA